MKKLDSLKDSMINWVREHADTPKAKWTLVGVAFTESSFFLVPPDLLLIAMVLAVPNRWRRFAGWTTIASVAGGVLGYLIGWLFFETIGRPIVDLYHLYDEMATVSALFAKNNFWVIFSAAFTPIPYKVFTLSAGLFRVDFMTFLVASILGRGIRFYLVGWLVENYGEKVGGLLYKYFNIISLVVVVVIALLILIFGAL